MQFLCCSRQSRANFAFPAYHSTRADITTLDSPAYHHYPAESSTVLHKDSFVNLTSVPMIDTPAADAFQATGSAAVVDGICMAGAERIRD